MAKTVFAKTDEEVGAALREKRQKRGFSLEWCAKELKISIAYLCQLETGKRRWRHSLVEQYETLLAK